MIAVKGKETEPKKNWKKRLMLGLLTMSFIFLACGTVNAPVEGISPTNENYKHTLESVTKTVFDHESRKSIPFETENLGMNVSIFARPLSVEAPSAPCGDPNLDLFTTLEKFTLVDERELLCNNLNTLSLVLGWNLDEKEIEKLATELIVLKKEDLIKYCTDCDAFWSNESNLIFLSPLSPPIIAAHEIAHFNETDELNYHSTDTGYCYTHDMNSFNITYDDPSSISGVSNLTSSIEVIPLIVEQFLISSNLNINQATGVAYNTPSYLTFSDNIDPQLRESLILDFSNMGNTYNSSPGSFDLNFLLEKNPSLQKIANLLEVLTTDNQINLIDLLNRLNLFMSHIFPEKYIYIPPIPTVGQPIDNCTK